jgi:hypothetical protein
MEHTYLIIIWMGLMFIFNPLKTLFVIHRKSLKFHNENKIDLGQT